MAYSTNQADFYRNFAPSPPQGTDPAVRTGSGTITFPEVDQAGEQSLFDANLNHGENALTPLSGAFAWARTVLARPVPGIAFDLEIGYSSGLPTEAPSGNTLDPFPQGMLGYNWRNTFEIHVVYGPTPTPNPDEWDIVNWDGSVQSWTRTNSAAPLIPRDHTYRGELAQSADSPDVLWTTPSRLVYRFHDPGDDNYTQMAGRLVQISDLNGNTVQIQWDWNEGFITNVVNSAGGNYQFNYDSKRQLLTSVTFGAWQVNFTYDPTNRLISKSLTNASGIYAAATNATWQFQYGTNGLLAQIIDPRLTTNTLVQYDQYGRRTNQVDALGRATRTEYDEPQTWQMRHTDPATFQWIESYDRKGHVLAQQDPLGNTTSFTYDANGNRTSITEPLGWTTSFGYDNNANVIARTNALGEVTTWVFDDRLNKPLEQITPQPPDENGWTAWTNFYTYDAAGNLTNHSDAIGTLVSYTYSTNGLVLASTDANGNVTRFGYDTNGFLNARTDPAGNLTSYVLNDLSWKMREMDALGYPTSYSYDQSGNLTKVIDVLGRTFYRTFDANGNQISETDGNQQLTTYAYDAANQRTNKINRTRTNMWAYAYTTRGKLDHVTDPLAHSVTNYYDAANRLIAISDPLGNCVTNQYDANGNVICFFDKLGRRWVKTYDHLDRLIAEADPLGSSKQTVYDVAGRVQQIISPNGFPSVNTYDGRGRLVQWMDPQKFPWRYDYDGVGNITNIIDALQGRYVMAYSNRNERVVERNQDGFEWRYTYDQLLRLKTQTDPNLVVRTIKYDQAGRKLFVNFSTGREDSFSYDNNDSVKTMDRSGAGQTAHLQFTYDVMDRVVEQDDANFQTVLYVLYGYDPLGRVTSITLPGNATLANSYDPLGRLTSQEDWAGRQTTYTYDLANRLLTRTYPNGVVQTNAFDAAGRIIALSYAAPNPGPSTNPAIQMALTYAYDRNGNKAGAGESGTLDWPLPSLTDETTQFTPAGRMIASQIQNNSAISNQSCSITYHYDASGNMTNAVGNGQSWSLGYDEDNRTTTLDWQAGTTNSHILNRYDALGRRFSKSVDGTITGYVLSLAGGMERVLCDLDANGNVTARYVHGPDLCYKLDATNGLTCYHADAMGNVLALTDGRTNLAAQYAYTPYGRSLGSTNFGSQISNPYLFVGSQGVMEELPGLFFMRARSYSAEAGAFLSTDPVRKIGPGGALTAYSYTSSNPLAGIDPEGTELVADVIAFGVAWTADAGVQIYRNARQHGWNLWDYKLSYTENLIAATMAAATTEVSTDAGALALGAGASSAAQLGIRALINAGADAWSQRLQNGSWANANLMELVTSAASPVWEATLPTFSKSSALNDLAISGMEEVLGLAALPLGQGSAGMVTLDSPTAGRTPMAVLPRPQSSAGGGGGSAVGASSSATLSGATAGAGIFGTLVTAINQNRASGPTMASGSSGSGGGGMPGVSFGRGGMSTATANSTAPYQPPSSSSSSTSMWTSVTSTVTSIWNGFTSAVGNLFGGFHWP